MAVEITTVERLGTILGILPADADYPTIQTTLDTLGPDALETVREGVAAYWKIKFKTTKIVADGATIDPALTRALIAQTLAQVTGLPNRNVATGAAVMAVGVTETLSDYPRMLWESTEVG